MRLLDDVHLIESDVLAPPTTSTFECSVIKLASYEHSSSWNKLWNSSWEYDQKLSLEENCGKIADFLGKTRFEVKVKSPYLSQWNIAVLSIADLVQLASKLVLAVYSKGEYYCHLCWAHALIRRYLTTRRKHALNKHVRRLYGNYYKWQSHSLCDPFSVYDLCTLL